MHQTHSNLHRVSWVSVTQCAGTWTMTNEDGRKRVFHSFRNPFDQNTDEENPELFQTIKLSVKVDFASILQLYIPVVCINSACWLPKTFCSWKIRRFQVVFTKNFRMPKAWDKVNYDSSVSSSRKMNSGKISFQFFCFFGVFHCQRLYHMKMREWTNSSGKLETNSAALIG